MNQPKPILEFYTIKSDRDTDALKITQSIADLRWLRVEEFFNAKAIAPNTKKGYERELQRFVNWTDKACYNINSHDIANYKCYLEGLQDIRGNLVKAAWDVWKPVYLGT